MKSKHTPTPWIVVAETSGSGMASASVARAPGGYGLAITGWGCVRQKPEDAEFIVRACNAHEQLVAALKEARDLLGWGGTPSNSAWVRQQVDAALAAAGA